MSKLDYICNLNAPLPCNITYPQVLRIRMCAPLGSQYSAYPMIINTMEKNKAGIGEKEGSFLHGHVSLWPQLEKFCFCF